MIFKFIKDNDELSIKNSCFNLLTFMVYPNDNELSFALIDYLRGPRKMAGKDYVISSYFKGATPSNNYLPTQPYQIDIEEREGWIEDA